MNNSRKLLKDFNAYPFESFLEKYVSKHYLTNRKKKCSNFASRPLLYYTLLLQLLTSFMHFQHVSSQAWDGVVVTASNFEALQAFKHELDDPKGCMRSWNDSGYGACSGGWEGIKCAQGEVIVIQLPRRELGGRISEKIGQLQALRKLSLHDNQLGGVIPFTLGILTNLRGLQLYNNRLSGSIPPSLGSCPLLQSLELGNNSLTGAIPDSLAKLTKLFRVDLSYNLLSGSIPDSLTRFPSLMFLSLRDNNFSGPIPNSWNAGKLQSLTLDHNFLSGSIPASLGKLSDLLEISLSYNRISGAIPIELGELSGLKTLDLSNNNLSGHVPPQLDHLNVLHILNVSYNNLSGPVPPLLLQKFNSSSFIGNIQLCSYNGSDLCTSQVPMELKSRGHKLSIKDIFLIVIGASLIVLIILCCILLSCLLSKRAALKRKRAQKTASDEKGVPVPGIGVEAGPGGDSGGKLVHFDGSLAFTADDLLCATAEILAKSTYGTVYKAIFEDGNQLAVKRLREKLAKNKKEFEAEVNVLGKVRHPNLLAMRAYYLGPKGEKLLVFDYMPKGNLSTFLHARGPNSPIDWPTRKKIIQDIARGLLYLHTNVNIMHTNLTSSNVLLDEDTNAKIADFGLYRLMTSAANTTVLEAAKALGYKAPELLNIKKANTKTDVYSLGVIMLELLTGKSPSEGLDGADLPQWVASIVKEEWTNEVFDLELMGDASTVGDELLNTLKLALHCVDPSPAARPEVQQVLQQLEEVKLEVPTSSGE